MLIRVISFLLETAFFLLIAAALLRGWMNWVRVNMMGQPGGFVMALTDWLVKPLRRALPKSITTSRLDWASVLAAALLALAYALLLSVLYGVLMGATYWDSGFGPLALLNLLSIALKMFVKVALQTLFIMVLGFAILSWVQPGSPAYGLLGRLTEAFLAPLRRLIPAIGGVDLSALVLLVLLQVGLMLLG